MKKMNMIASGVFGVGACIHSACYVIHDDSFLAACSFAFAAIYLALCMFHAYMAGQES